MPCLPALSAPLAPTGVDLHLPAQLGRLPELAAFAKEVACRAPLGEKAAGRLRLILEELFTNVCVHGNTRGTSEDAPYTVHIHGEVRGPGRALHLTFRDTAPAFDPLGGPPPGVLLLPLEDLPMGGQGLHLVRTLAQEPRYARAEECNIFTFFLALE